MNKVFLNNRKFRIGKFRNEYFIFLFLLLSLMYSKISTGQNCSINANVDFSICANQTLTLVGNKSGLFPGGGGGITTWSQVMGPSVIITSPNALTTTVTGIIGGNIYRFRLSTTCQDGSLIYDEVNVTVKPVSIANAGSDQTLCPGSGSLNGSSLLPAETGLWTIQGNNDAGINLTSPSTPSSGFTLTPGSAGSTTLRWTITGGNGCTAYDEVVITNRGGVTPVTAGADQILSNCYSSTQSTTLHGSFGGVNISGQKGTWTLISGPNIPVITNPSMARTGVTNLIEGVYIFRWTVTGPCVSGFAEEKVTVPPPAGSVTGVSVSPSNPVYCDGRTSLVLSGSQPLYANETVQWTYSGPPGVTIVSPSSPTSLVSGLNGSSSYTFTYSLLNSLTGCSSSASTTISYATAPSLSLTSPNPLFLGCSVTSATITYSTSGIGTIQYSVLSGPAGTSFTYPTTYANAGSSPYTITGFTQVGTYVVRFRKAATGSSCSSVFQDITIVTSSPPSGSNAGTRQFVSCNTTSATLAGNVIAFGIASWSQVSGPNTAIIADIYDKSTAISGLTNGRYIFRWLVSGGNACPPSQSDVQVMVANVAPDPVTATGPASPVCAMSPITLTGRAPILNERGRWTVTPDDGIAFSDSTNYITVATGMSPNTTYTYRWTIRNSCSTAWAEFVVSTTGIEGPVQSQAGPDQCLNTGTTTVTLAGNDPSPGTGLWTKVSGPSCSITSSGLYNTTVTGTSSGTYKFEWRLSYGPGCTDSRDTVMITIGTVTSANAGPDQNICGTTATLSSNAAGSGETGSWRQISGPGGVIISDSTSTSPILTNLLDGAYLFRWTITLGACSDYDEVQINVSTVSPVIPNAGPDQAVCGLTSVTMAGNNVSPGTGLWSVVSGPATPVITSPASPVTTITGLIPGTYTFKWTSSGGIYCTPLSDFVNIVVSPVADAGNDANYCNANSVNLTGTLNSSGTWSLVSGPAGSVITPTAPNTATVSGLVTGVYVFRYTISAGGACVSPSSDDVTITNFSTTDVAVIDRVQTLTSYCNTASITLYAMTPALGTGTWTKVSGPSATINSPNSTTTTVTVTTGTYLFRWTVSNGSCSSVDEITVDNYAPPTTANAGPDQNHVCGYTAVMNANLPAVGLGNWTQISGPNTATIVSPVLPNTMITGMTPGGPYVFRWTISNGICSSSTSDMTITVFDPPQTANAGSDQNLCAQTSTVLAATPVSGGTTGQWSQISGPTTVTFSDATSPSSTVNNLSPGTSSGSYVLRWTTTYNGCTDSDDVTIRTDAAPTVATGTDINECLYTNIFLTGNAPVVGTGLWNQTGGTPVFIVDPSLPNSQIAGALTGTYYFTWTISNGLCPASNKEITVVVNEIPTPANAGPDQNLCNVSTSTLGANTPDPPGTGTWSVISQPGTTFSFTDIHNPETAVNGIEVGTTLLRWTISVGSCSSYDEVQIIRNPTAVVTGPADATLCNGGTQLLSVVASGGTSYTYQWEQAPASTGPWINVSGGSGGTTSSYTTPVLTTGNYYYRCKVECGGVYSDVAHVAVVPDPQITSQPVSATICSGTTNTFSVSASGGTPSLTYQWQISTTGCFGSWSNIGSANAAIYTTNPLTQTTYYRVLISASGTGCNTTTSSCVAAYIPHITTQPSALTTICSGGTTTLSVAVGSDGGSATYSYQWQYSGNTGGPYTSIPSETNPSFTTSALSTGDYYYRCVVYSSTPTCTMNSNEAYVRVLDDPSISVQPAGATICAGQTHTLTVTASGGTPSLNYQWQSSTDNITWTNTGTNSSTYTTPALSSTTYYQVIVSSSGEGCNSVTSSSALVTVNPVPSVTSGLTQTVCSGSAANLALTTTPNIAGTTFTYPVPTVTGGITGGTARAVGTSDPITDVLVNPTGVVHTATYMVTPTGPAGLGSCVGVAKAVVITVNPKPNGVPRTKTICSGNNVSQALTTSPVVSGTTFTYPAPVVTGGVTGGNARPVGTTGPINDVLVNPTGTAQTATYTVTPTSPAGCVGSTFTVVVTVNPRPTGVPETKTICSGLSVNQPLTTNPVMAGTTFTYPAPVVTGGITGGSARSVGSAANITDILVNPTAAIQTATYTVTPTSAGCPGSPFTVVVTVNPKPVIIAGLAQNLCADAFGNATASLVLTTTPAMAGGVTYAWPVPTLTGGMSYNDLSSGTSTIIDTYINGTVQVQTATYTITPTAPAGLGGCVGNASTIIITVNPVPAVTSGLVQTICSGVNANRSLTSSTTGTLYSYPSPTISGAPGNITGGSARLVATANAITDLLVNTTGTAQTATYQVTPWINGCPGTPEPVVITVNPKPSGVPQTKTICSGDPVNQSLSTNPVVTGTTFTYPSPTVTGGITGGVARLIGTSADITDILVNPTGVAQTATYNLTPTSPDGCVGNTFTVVVTVNPTPSGVPRTKSICSGTNVNQSLTTSPVVTGTTFTYPSPVVTGGITGGTARLTGTADPIIDVLINPTGTAQTATYTITPTSPEGCTGSTFTVIVTVNPTPAGVPQTKSICSGQLVNQALSTSPLVAGTTFTYPVPVVTGGITGGSSRTVGSSADITDNLVNPTASVQTATYTITPTSPDGCVGSPFNIGISVNPKPQVTHGLTQNLCADALGNATASRTLTTTPTMAGNVSYSWPAPTLTGGMTYINNGTGNIITDDYINPTSEPQTATYVVTPTASVALGGCVGDPSNVVITVNPKPVLTSGLVKSICSGTPVNLSLTTTPVTTGALFTYPVPDATGGVTGGLSRTIPGSGPIGDVLVNPTGTAQTVTYHVTPWINNCPGNIVDVVVTVDPTPTGVPLTKTICNGQPVNQTLSTNPPIGGVTFTYPTPVVTGGVTGGNARLAGSPDPINDILVNTTAVNQTATYTITPLAGGCSGSPFTVVVTVSPTPLADAGPPQFLCNAVSTVMTGNDPSPGTGLWTQVSGPNVPAILNPTMFNTTVTTMIPGVYVLKWTISNGSCVPSESTVAITNYSLPTTATTGPEQNQCGTLVSGPLGGNTPVSGTGIWSIVSGGTGTFSAPGSGSSTFTANTYGTYNLRWTISNGNCPVSTADITLNFFQSPTTATVGATQNICGSLTSSVLGGNTPVIGTGQWSVISGGTGTFSALSSGNSTFTADNYGTYILRWTISNGSCTPSTADVSVNFYQNPTAAVVGSTQNHCSTLLSAGLGGNTPVTGSGMWSIVSGGTGLFIFPTAGNTVFIANNYGTYVLRWTISNGTCTPSTADITVNYYQNPTTASAGVAQSICGSLVSSALGGNTPVIGTGAWSIVSGGKGTFSAISSGNSTFTADNYGTYILRWTISNGVCVSSSADVTINFYASTIVSDAGPPQMLCNAGSTTLAGNDPSPGTGLWTQVSGPNVPAILNPTMFNTTVTTMIPGVYVLKWTISNGSCVPSESTVAITNYSLPTAATTGPEQNQCGTLVSGPLGGNTPVSGTGIWSIVSGGTGTFSAPGSGSSTFTANTYGTYNLRWTISNGNCPVSTADITLNFFQSPTTATVGATQNICGSLTSSVLGGNTPAIGTGSWSIVSGGSGSFSQLNSGTSTFTAGNYGSYLLRWSITNGPCPPSEADVIVNFYQNPTTASAGPAQNHCSTLVSNGLGGNTPVIGTGQWSIVSGGTGIFINPSAGNTVFIANSYGSYVLRWTISNGTCPPSSANLNVSFYQSPTTATTGANQSICGSMVSAALGGNTPVIGTGSWSIVSGGTGVFSNPTNGNSSFTANGYETYTLKWTISNGVCSPSSANVTVSFYPVPVTSHAGPAQTLCNAISTTLAGNNPFPGTGLWTMISGPNVPVITFPYSPTSTVTSLVPGVYVFKWTISSGSCVPSESTVTVVNYELPTVSVAGPDQDHCGPVMPATTITITMAANTPSVGTGLWTILSGPGTPVITNPNSPTTTITGLSTGVYEFDWIISNGSCVSSSEVVITVADCAPVTFNENIYVCKENTTTIDVLANGDYSPQGYPLSVIPAPVKSPDHGTLTWTMGSSYTYTPVSGYTGSDMAIVSVCDNLPLCTNDTINIHVVSGTVADAGPDQVLCEQSTTTLTGNYPPPGSIGTWSFISGPTTAIPSPPNTPAASVIGLIPSTTPYVFRYTVSTTYPGAICSDYDEMTVTNYNYPSLPYAGPDQDLCLSSGPSTSTLLNGSTPLYGTGTWIQDHGPSVAVIADPASPTSGISNLIPGSYTFLWRIGNGPCDPNQDEVVINVHTPATGNAGPDATICNTTSHTLSGSSASGYTSLLWGTTGTGYFNDPTLLHPVYTPGNADVTAGSVNLYMIAYSTAPCSNSRDTLVLTIHKQGVANAGPDGTICETSAFTVSGASAQNATSVQWTSSGTGSFTGSSTLTPTYTPSAADITAGSVTLTLTVSSATGCIPVSDAMVLTITRSTTVNAGADATICSTTNYTIADATATNFSSLNWTTSGTGTFNNPGTLHPIYTPGAADINSGSVTLTLNVTAISPCSNTSEAMVLTISKQATANAGPNSSTCQGVPFTVSGATATNYSSLQWTATGSGTLSNSTSLTPTYTPSAGQTGVVTLTLTAAGIFPCTGVTSQLQLNVLAAPQANAGPDELICEGSAFTVSGSSASGYASIYWTTSGTGTFVDATILHPVYTPGLSDILSGNVTLTLTVNGNSPCSSVQDMMILSISRAPLAEAGPNGTTCQGNPFTVSGASAQFFTGLLWTHNGMGTLGGETTLTPTYVPAIYETGPVTLTLTVTGNSPCLSVTDFMTIDFVPSPVANAGPDGSTCQGNPFTVTQASAQNYSGIFWIHNGTGVLTNENTMNPTYMPGGNESGPVLLTMTIYGYPPCGSVSDAMILQVSPDATADAGIDLITCGLSEIEITGSTATNYTSLTWTTSGTGTFNDPTTLHPVYMPSLADTLNGQVILTLTATSGPGCLPVSDGAVLTILKTALAYAGPDAATCLGSPFTVTGATAYYYSSVLWTHNGQGILSGETTMNPSYTPASGEYGDVTLTLNVSPITPCPPAVDHMILSISQSSSADAGPDAATCEDDPYLISGSSAVNYSSITWTTSGSGTFDDSHALHPSYSPGASDIINGFVRLTMNVIPVFPCPATSSYMTLVITGKATADAGPDVSTCFNVPFLLTGATAQHFSSLIWSHTGTGTLLNPETLNPTYIPGVQEVGTVILKLTVTGTDACSSFVQQDDMTLTILQKLVADAGKDQSIPPNTSTWLNVNVTGGTGLYIYSWEPAPLLLGSGSDHPETVRLNEDVLFMVTATDYTTGCKATDSVWVFINQGVLPVIANEDFDTTGVNVPITIDVLANDVYSKGKLVTVTLCGGPWRGLATVKSNNTVYYAPDRDYAGEDSLCYLVCYNEYPSVCDTATVYIHISNDSPANWLTIYNVMTPNSDGVNDKWIIDGIEKFPNNSVLIFNRWGDQVKSFDRYNNTSEVWSGQNDKGEKLPDGTYFYILTIKDGGSRSGWVLLRGSSK